MGRKVLHGGLGTVNDYVGNWASRNMCLGRKGSGTLYG